MIAKQETFRYDALDRLTTINHGVPEVLAMKVDYEANGNVERKTNLGKYNYHDKRKHAVETIENTGNLIPDKDQTITYTAFNKASQINETVGADAYQLDIKYGPDQQRWKTVLKKNNSVTKTTIFAGDYEKITDNGVTRELYYISGGDGLAAVYVKTGSSYNMYYVHTDHLGSIVKLTTATDTTAVFRATYDAWGRQTITKNTFKFHRGYTGHEHLPEFGLINMNGRMYDPVVGRFLSPDPFVQAPEFSQSFNRYSYCYNNPLIYTDPSGEFFWIAGIIGFVVNYVNYGITNHDWKWAAVGSGVIGAAVAMVGAGVGSVATSASTAIGIGTGASGIIGGAVGGAAAGALGSSINGGNVGQGALYGSIGGAIGGATGLLSQNVGFWGRGAISTLSGGGVGAGIAALSGENAWDGFRNGAIGGVVGFVGNELSQYIDQSRAENKHMRETLGLTQEQIRELKSYGLGKINTMEWSDADMAIWEQLKAGHTDIKSLAEILRTRDYDNDAIIKAGRMHIRYGSKVMTDKGAYTVKPGTVNVHYDRFDVILTPALHLLFDTFYQGILGVH